MTKHATRCLAMLRRLEKEGVLHITDVKFLRDLAFNHRCRSDHLAGMVTDLIPIYTILAVKERLTT